VLGTTSGASQLSGSCSATTNAPETVYQWTPTVSGTATIQTCSTTQTTFDTVLYLRQGPCASGTQVACNDDTTGCGTTTDVSSPHRGSVVTPTVTADQPYFIVVDGYSTSQGSFALTVTPPSGSSATTTTTLPSSGGTCAAPIVLPAQGGTFSGATSGASQQAGTCAATGSAPDVVYQWTPAVSGTATIQTCSTTQTTFDTVLYLRQGNCASGTQVACNDDTTGCGTTTDVSNPHRGSVLNPTVTAGQPYFIIVDGYSTSQGGFALTLTPPSGTPTTTVTSTTSSTVTTSSNTSSTSTTSTSTTSTSNSTPTTSSTSSTLPAGTCSTPIVLPAEGGAFTGTTSGTSALAGNCTSASGTAPEQVFQWTAPRSGTATIKTCSTTLTAFDTVLYLRRGACAGGTEVACNDDTTGCGTTTDVSNPHRGSTISPAVTAGQVYYIVVDGYATAKGNFLLTLTPPP